MEAYFEMPKPGYTKIIVKSEIRDMLEKLAAAQGYRSINQLLEAWIRVHPTAFNGEIRRSETGPNLSPDPKMKQGFWWWTGGDLNPRPPECKSGVHSRLNYRPSRYLIYFH